MSLGPNAASTCSVNVGDLVEYAQKYKSLKSTVGSLQSELDALKAKQETQRAMLREITADAELELSRVGETMRALDDTTRPSNVLEESGVTAYSRNTDNTSQDEHTSAASLYSSGLGARSMAQTTALETDLRGSQHKIDNLLQLLNEQEATILELQERCEDMTHKCIDNESETMRADMLVNRIAYEMDLKYKGKIQRLKQRNTEYVELLNRLYKERNYGIALNASPSARLVEAHELGRALTAAQKEEAVQTATQLCGVDKGVQKRDNDVKSLTEVVQQLLRVLEQKQREHEGFRQQIASLSADQAQQDKVIATLRRRLQQAQQSNPVSNTHTTYEPPQPHKSFISSYTPIQQSYITTPFK